MLLFRCSVDEATVFMDLYQFFKFMAVKNVVNLCHSIFLEEFSGFYECSENLINLLVRPKFFLYRNLLSMLSFLQKI